MTRHGADRYACFQWIRNVRAGMARDMQGMTPEERSAYINNRYEEAKKERPQYTLEESRSLLKTYLAEPIRSSQKGTAKKETSKRRKNAKPLAHV